VISTNKSILLSVGKVSFTTIFGNNQNSLAEFTLRLLRGSSELKHLLSHSLGMSTFRTFLRKSVAEENLDFWIAANEFRTSSQGKDWMKTRAEEIFGQYCKESSEHQVNLPCSMRSSLQKAIEECDFIKDDLFTPSIDEIYRLLERDNYARFKRSPEFNEFFKCLGILIEDNI